MKRIDLSRKRFGRLVVKEYAFTKQGAAYWLVVCDCGKEKIIRGTPLSRGLIRSCGCLANEMKKQRRSTHNMSYSSEYKSWTGMKERCYNNNNSSYKNYGGRGIKVCDRWLESFENFYTDMGKCSDGYSIDRIDVNGDYCPENCRWANAKTQGRNKRNNVKFTYMGLTATLPEWAELTGIAVTALKSRIARKYPIHIALLTPKIPKGSLRSILIKEHRLIFH